MLERVSEKATEEFNGNSAEAELSHYQCEEKH